MAPPARHIKGHSSPRAARCYDYVALRAMSLHGGLPPPCSFDAAPRLPREQGIWG
ncbi:MAG: hypothetical protein J6X49_02155 [Victivallales bacterium]|nr:hypothetical protein [Victivallales bacterium]